MESFGSFRLLSVLCSLTLLSLSNGTGKFYRYEFVTDLMLASVEKKQEKIFLNVRFKTKNVFWVYLFTPSSDEELI